MVLLYLLRSTCRDYAPAGFSAARSHVYNVIRVSYHVEVVLDYNNGRAVIKQSLKYPEQYLHVKRVQADTRFVEHEYRVCLSSADLACKFQALGFAAGKAGSFLAESEVPEPELLKHSEPLAD